MSGSLLIILSKNPYSDVEASLALDLAAKAAKTAKTSVYLIEDGINTVRHNPIGTKTSVAEMVSQLITSGVKFFVEDVSLRLRGLNTNRLLQGVKVSNLDELVEMVMEKVDRTVWF